MKLVLEISGAEDEAAAYRVVEAFPVTLGRAYSNDIILPDPHVAARHLRLEWDGANWAATDLGSVNPILVNKKPVRGKTVPLASGDVLRVGGMRLRVFSPDHPVEEETRLHRAGPWLARLLHPSSVWALFVLAIAMVTGWTYLDVWTDDIEMLLAATAATVVTAIFVWAGLWSVAGRMLRRRTFFLGHVALASLYILLSVAISAVVSWSDFILNENALAAAFDHALNALALALLIYASLAFSSAMKKRKRFMAAAFFSLGAVIGVFAVGLISAQKFSPDPHYPARLEPYAVSLLPAKTPEGFLARGDKLFQSGAFAVDEAGK